MENKSVSKGGKLILGRTFKREGDFICGKVTNHYFPHASVSDLLSGYETSPRTTDPKDKEMRCGVQLKGGPAARSKIKS